MKLPIKKEYFDRIKSGEKIVEYRDAHITFICEETGETLTKKVIKSSVKTGIMRYFKDVLKDKHTIVFELDSKR